MRRPLSLDFESALEQLGPYTSRQDCLELIYRSLERNGLATTAVPERQRRLLEDLSDPFDEAALGQMFDLSTLNLAFLESRASSAYRVAHAKPRIDIFLEITSKDNLRMEWFPRGWEGRSEDGSTDCDFIHWSRLQNRTMAFDSRPSNELMFLHGVGDAILSAGRKSPELKGFIPLDHILLRASSAAVRELKERLAYAFHVRMRADVVERWSGDGFRTHGRTDLIEWNVRDSERIRLDTALEKIANFKSKLGVDADELGRIWKEFSDAATSTTRRNNINSDIAARLRALGKKDVKRPHVDEAIALLKEHDPAVLTQ